jgi:hypothetical protein
MTSILARPPPTSRLPEPAQLVINTYTDTGGNSAPLPWRYNKQTSAIDFDFVNGFAANTTFSTNNAQYFQGQTFSAIHLVLQLGPNFIQWCETSSSLLADAGSVVMIQQPIVAYGNLVAVNVGPNSTATFQGGLTENPLLTMPTGPVSSKYYKTLIFQRPLTIQYTVSGVTRFAFFGNNFEGNT